MSGALYLGGIMTGYPSVMSVRVMAAKEKRFDLSHLFYCSLSKYSVEQRKGCTALLRFAFRVKSP